MSHTNIFDIEKNQQKPSPEFCFHKKQSEMNRLTREILMKEYQFKHCQSLSEDIQKRLY